MTDNEIYKRLANIETNIAVLVASAKTRDKQFEEMNETLKAHIVKEERIVERIFAKQENIKETCDVKHATIDAKIAGFQGELNGAAKSGKWIALVITTLISMSLFLGLKGLK